MTSEIENSDNSNGEKFVFRAFDNTEIHGTRWFPQSETVKAILIINHGMAEHIRRYGDFARYLNSKGIGVIGEDHRGHGLTAKDEDNLGFFTDDFGWQCVIQDIRDLHLMIRQEFPGVPVIMFGHSMGSFLTRFYLKEFGDDLAGAIISGTGYTPGYLSALGSFIASTEILLKGPRHRSKVLDSMSFGRFNKPYENEKDSTGFEWLSRDRKQVEKYYKDPLCGFICTSSHFRDLFTGLKVINQINAFQKTPDNLPLLLISGEDDPVGDRGKGVEKVHSLYKKGGIRDITVNLVPGARHECLNEINKNEVYTYLTDWMEKKVIS